jgi:hypothetical protein
MTKITTDFVGTEDSSVRLSRLQQITDFYFGSGAFTGASNLGEVRGLLNSVSPVSIANGDFFGTWLLPVNVLNDPDALIAEYLTGLNGAWSGQLDPALGRLFLDEAGTTPATAPGQVIRRVNHRAGTITHVTFASGQAPTLGRHPTSDHRNRLPNNRMDGAAVGVVGSGGALPTGWGVSNVPAGSVEVLSLTPKSGRPNIRLRITGTPTNNIVINYIGSAAATLAANGQTWTGSVWAQMVGGDLTNLSNPRVAIASLTDVGAFIATEAESIFTGTIAADERRTVSATLAGGGTVARTRTEIRLGWTSGAIDITLDISAPQLEQAGSASAVQITGASGFDVTEAPFADCWYLEPDGLDDFGTFSAAFAPAGAYTLAAALNVPGGVLTPIFGRVAGNAIFNVAGSNRASINFNPAVNNRIWDPGLTGRQALIARVRGTADYDMRRNGVDLAEDTGAAVGNIFPAVNPFDSLFRVGSTYAPAGTKLYAYFLADANQPDARRNALERVLTSYNGVPLP